MIETAEVTKKENTILAQAVTLVDAPIKQKRSLKKAVESEYDRILLSKCHGLVQHVIFSTIGKQAAKAAKVSADG